MADIDVTITDAQPINVNLGEAVNLYGSAGGGSGAVSSVNDKVGAVVLTATDVGADPTGSAATAENNAKSYTDTQLANKVAISTLTTDATLTGAQSTVLADATAASMTLTLPSATGLSGKIYNVKKIDSSANTVTIATTSSQTIDGATTAVIGSQYEAVTVQSDGTNWYII